MSKLRLVLWTAVAVALVGVGFLVLAPSRVTSIPFLVAPETDGVQARFELTDQNGMVQTQDEFRGRWMLIFFGFTNCPDICPTGLATILAAMDNLGADREQVQPIFVTVNPSRDTPSRLKEYLAFFDPAIVGLGGTDTQLELTAGAFKIYYERLEDEGAPDGYTMGHTPNLLLFDDEGVFVRTFDHNATPSEVADDLRGRI